jgi:serine O-acetyltransferase
MNEDRGLRASLECDLAANSSRVGLLGAIGAFFLNPGFTALVLYRVSHSLQSRKRGGRLASTLVWRLNVYLSGCYLHPKAKIASGLCLPHPIGIIIGADVRVGANVSIYQHVTLGSSTSASFEYPTIGEGTIVYAGAVIVGSCSIGRRATIGANAVVIGDVPDGAVAVGIPARILPNKGSAPIMEDVPTKGPLTA